MEGQGARRAEAGWHGLARSGRGWAWWLVIASATAVHPGCTAPTGSHQPSTHIQWELAHTCGLHLQRQAERIYKSDRCDKGAAACCQAGQRLRDR